MTKYIFRKQSKDRPFTTIENDTIRDERLSWKATGLLCYLLSLPPEWRVNGQDLSNRKTDGRFAVKSALDELESAGYLKRSKIRDEAGQIVAHEVFVYEESITRKPDYGRGFPHMDKPSSGKPRSKKETKNTNDEVKESDSSRLIESWSGEMVEIDDPESENL